MSFRKTKLIQEKNLLLERKYILEQAPPPPPPAPGLGTPPPAPAAVPPAAPIPAAPGGVTPPNQGTQEKKFTEEDIKKAIKCSSKREKIDKTKYEMKEQKINGITYVFYLTEKKDMIYCRDENKQK